MGVMSEAMAADSLLSPRPSGRANPFEGPTRDYTGIPIGGWMLYPTLKVGVTFDDNIYGSPVNKRSATGLAVSPSFVATRNTGIHDTTVFSDFNMRFYPADSRANVVDGKLGLIHVWEIERDLIFRLSADYTRSTEVNPPLVGVGGVPVRVTPSHVNTFAGAASLQKSFNSFFVALGGSVSTSLYEDISIGGLRTSQSFRNGTTYTITGRAGYWFAPSFYAFVEPSVNWKRYDSAFYDNDGERVVGGIGTDRVSLFKGEIYAGYQRQRYNAVFGDVSGGVYGARLQWFPTRDLTVSASLDRSLGLSTQPTIANVFGAPTVTTTASLSANYEFNRRISANARVSYQNIDYKQSTRHDDQWNGGLGVTYTFAKNLGVSADYAFTRLNSNAALVSYTRNIFTLSAVYKY